MNTQELVDLAELALAGYGRFVSEGLPPTNRLTILNGDEAGFATSQADRFQGRFEVARTTYSDATSSGGSGSTSFDATVFTGRVGADLNRIFISFRGVQQQVSDGMPNDIQAVSDIVVNGAAFGQIVQMVNWWQRVSTPVGVGAPRYVPQYGLTPDGRSAVRIADAICTGEVAVLLAASPDAKVTVTGSSLGGHLAMAFAALFPAATAQAFAFNSPGFADNAFVRSLFSALGGSVPNPGNPTIMNIVSSEANNAGDRLDVIAGFPGGSYPGLLSIVPIENQYNSDVLEPKVPSWNHDQRQITDSLAVFDMLPRLDPALTLQQFGDVMRRSKRRNQARHLSPYPLLVRLLRQRNFVDVHWSFP